MPTSAAPRARRRPRLALAALAAVTLSTAALSAGCAGARRPSATTASLLADGERARAAHRAAVDSIVDRLARRAARRGDRTLDVLLLSGGWQNGAYGTGFLRGWRTAGGAGAMPRFDLVTGVSTGALQAPFALLGTGPALDTLAAIYARAADRIAPTVDWLWWLRRTGGVVRTGRYEATIAAVVDARLRDDLRAAFAEGRQLAVATTDYDLGTGRLWDLADVLGATDTARARLDAARDVFYTSTAIPGVFPPRVLDGHAHGDGGTIANVLPALDLDDYRALAGRLRARGVDGPVTVRLWVVQNFWTHARPEPLAVASRRKVSARSNALLFWTQQSQALAALATLGRAVSADVPGLRLEVRATAIPAEYSLDPAAGKLFDAGFMARLAALGEARARSASPWDVAPGRPLPTPYERPAAAPR